jgi:hypothetical protein
MIVDGQLLLDAAEQLAARLLGPVGRLLELGQHGLDAGVVFLEQLDGVHGGLLVGHWWTFGGVPMHISFPEFLVWPISCIRVAR